MHFLNKKLETAYSNNNEDFDFVMMSLSTPKIYVEVVTKLSENHINSFKTTTVEGKRYVVDEKGNLICPYNSKVMEVTNEGGKIIVKILADNLNLLNDKDLFSYISINEIDYKSEVFENINEFFNY